MCVAHVGGALKKLSGVCEVKVNLETNTADIYSDNEIAEDAIKTAIEAAGYKFNGTKEDTKMKNTIYIEGMM